MPYVRHLCVSIFLEKRLSLDTFCNGVSMLLFLCRSHYVFSVVVFVVQGMKSIDIISDSMPHFNMFSFFVIK